MELLFAAYCSSFGLKHPGFFVRSDLEESFRYYKAAYSRAYQAGNNNRPGLF